MGRALNKGMVLITVLASSVTLAVTYNRWYQRASLGGRLAIVFLSVFIVILTGALVWQEYRYARKARYAESLSMLSYCFLGIQEMAAPDQVTADGIKEKCRGIVTELATVFTVVTGTRCSVCIKVIEGEPSARTGDRIRPKVQTLCGDTMSRGRDSRAPRVDWVDQNTDFERLHKAAGTPRGRAFFSNYLPGLRGYKNSSFQIYGDAPDIYLPVLLDAYRDFSWPLPYRSTIVVPISPLEATEGAGLAGYLCVDSKSRYVFSKQYDIDLLAAVAASLYEPVYQYCRLRASDYKGV